jgi:hypothetical protein
MTSSFPGPAIRLLDGRPIEARIREKVWRHSGHASSGGRKYLRRQELVERATGIEPVSEAWEASVLPLY